MRDQALRDEQDLVESMRGGSLSASEELLRRYSEQNDRTHDAVNVCLRLAKSRAGDAEVLERLVDAAVRDDDSVLVMALRHVQRIFTDSQRAPMAPPLANQPIVPDGLLKVVCGDTEPVLEVLSLVLQSLPQLLRRPANIDQSTRIVSPESLMPLGQLTAMVTRLFGARVPVLHRDGPRPVQFHVFVDPVPKLLVEGPDLADTPEFRFHFGGMVLATRPEFALMLALPEDEVRALLDAVLLAFGPPGRVHASAANVASLAQRLWESGPHAQRRMAELAARPEAIDYRVAWIATLRAMRRAGLFVSGDLGVAARQVCADEGLDYAQLSQPHGLKALCDHSPALADIVRFAISREYANARWRPARAGSSIGER